MGSELQIRIDLPEWLADERRRAPRLETLESRMTFVIGLAQANVERETGGPFGAAVFDDRDGSVVAAGVNLVLRSGYSVAHAEVVALSLAQRTTGQLDLAREGPHYSLVSSAEPCSMCLGASLWSGVARLACGARSSDVEAIGFDEGPKPEDWVRQLRDRGIAVSRDVAREPAVAVLRRYRDRGGVIY